MILEVDYYHQLQKYCTLFNYFGINFPNITLTLTLRNCFRAHFPGVMQ